MKLAYRAFSPFLMALSLAAALPAAGLLTAELPLAACASAPEGAARISASVPATVMQFRTSVIVIGPIHRRLKRARYAGVPNWLMIPGQEILRPR